MRVHRNNYQFRRLSQTKTKALLNPSDHPNLSRYIAYGLIAFVCVVVLVVVVFIVLDVTNTFDILGSSSSNGTVVGSTGSIQYISSSTAAAATSAPAHTSAPSVTSTTPPPSGNLPLLTAVYNDPVHYPAPMLQYGALGGLSSTCWFNEWMVMMSAKLQPTLQGTPRMVGNWSGQVANAATWQGCNSMYYASTIPEYASYKAPSTVQDRVGGGFSTLFYVDGTNGNDNTGTGASSAPFQTLARALVSTRAMTGSKTILFQTGFYYFSETLMLTGPEDAWLTLMAVPGEDVVFVGGMNMNVAWSQYASDICVTNIESSLNVTWAALNEVFQGTTRLTRARWPNGNPWDPLDTNNWNYNAFRGTGNLYTGTASYVTETSQHTTISGGGPVYASRFQMEYNGPLSRFSPPQSYWPTNVQAGIVIPECSPYGGFSSKLSSYTDVSNSFFHMLQGDSWGSDSFQISEMVTSSTCPVNAASGCSCPALMFSAGGWQEARGCDSNGPGSPPNDCDGSNGLGNGPLNRGYIDNQLAELDVAGEYYLDLPNQKIYLWTTSSCSSLATTLEVSQVPTMIWIQNTTNITIQGITIQHTSNSFMSAFQSFGGGDWSGTHEGAIRITNCHNCTVANCLLTQLGGAGIVVDGSSNGTYIGFNEISYIGDNAIAVLGTIIGWDASQEWYQPSFTTIQSNLIMSVGHYNKQSGAVFVAQTYCVTIDGNVMMIGPRTGVNLNDMFGGCHVVSNNVMLAWSMETSDVGPVNGWGRNAFYVWNYDTQQYSWNQAISYLHDNLILCDYNCATNVVLNNQALDFDDGSDRLFSYHNVLMISITKWHDASDLNYTDNLLFGFSPLDYVVPPDNNPRYTSSWFVGNTFWSLQEWNSGCYQSTWPLYYMSPPSANNWITPFNGIPTLSNNKYYIAPTVALPIYYTAVYTPSNSTGTPLTLAQYQAGVLGPYPSAINEVGSTQSFYPTQYPYHRFWGMNFLNLAIASQYDQSTTPALPTSIFENVAVGPGATYTDCYGNVWHPAVSCAIARGGCDGLVQGGQNFNEQCWPPQTTSVTDAPTCPGGGSTNFLYSAKGFTNYCAFNLQAGTYQVSYLLADPQAAQALTVYLQGQPVFTGVSATNTYRIFAAENIVVGSNNLLILEIFNTASCGGVSGIFSGFAIQPQTATSNFPAGQG